ncbi:class I SAM-dependent methyltransferase [Daejeonella lutea]|uniref:Methyltransferase domain-containing protein n=1 Tax=Daejeonella lutea TaxID=572036 RepID=A0A1T5FBW9_9SPHI|nr:class I SAM-dependent methyltransferase [Daejeonella lutea]SKB93568.1 Methyltransferase domain-containing protein [Daejeonella lutea]
MKKLEKLDYRLPKWDMTDLQERHCPICGTLENKQLYLRPDNLVVKNCGVCSVYYISPSPSPEQINQFYAQYDSNHRKTKDLRINKSKLDLIFGTDHFGDLRIRKLASMVDFKNSSFLDVGFGIPYFLYHLQKLGGNVFGVEYDNQAIDYARQSGLDNVFFGKISDLPKELKFDVISMNDLIEHPLNPLDLLNEAFERLNPGGRILIWTPNGDFSKKDPNSTTFRVDLEHMQYFTTKSIAYLASKLNASIEHLECYGFPALGDLVAPQTAMTTAMSKLKTRLKDFYPVHMANEFKRLYLKRAYEFNNRKGSYHLFAILQKK